MPPARGVFPEALTLPGRHPGRVVCFSLTSSITFCTRAAKISSIFCIAMIARPAVWSDSQIAAALDVGIATIQRTRRQLVEEGFESVLTRKYNANSARPPDFDGVAEAKLIALTCGPAPVTPNGPCACSKRKWSNCRLLVSV
jgi:hypothetical protein